MSQFTPDEQQAIAQIMALVDQEEAQKAAPQGPAPIDESALFREAFVRDVSGAANKVAGMIPDSIKNSLSGLPSPGDVVRSTGLGYTQQAPQKPQALSQVEIINGVKYVLTNGKYVKVK